MNILCSASLALKAKPCPVQPGECVEWLKLAHITPLALNNYGWPWTKLFFTWWKTAGELQRTDPVRCRLLLAPLGIEPSCTEPLSLSP